MISKTVTAFAVIGALAVSTSGASAQVGGGNEMLNQAKMMGKSHMKMHRSMKLRSVKKMHIYVRRSS